MIKIFETIHKKGHFLEFLGILLIAAGYSWFYFAFLPNVPFHPDESSQLFTSADVEDFFSNPMELSYQSVQESDQRQLYRLMDAPLTRYLIGIGRWVSGQAPHSVDWDWSKSWDENKAAGSLPQAPLLLTARLSVAILFPISLILFYLTLRNTGSRLTALLGLLFLAFNALALLHTRRAMAESALIFTIILTVWAASTLKGPAWMIAVPIALAVNAKQSAVALLAVGLIFLAFFRIDMPWKKRVLAVGIYFLVFSLIYFLLNPFLWSNPLQAAAAALHARQDLLARQVEEIRQARPDLIFDTLPDRLAGLLAHLYFTPPAVADIGNYLENTQPAEAIYFANPFHQLGRGLTWGSLFLTASLFGFTLGTMKWIKFSFRPHPSQADKSALVLGLLWMCSLVQSAVNLLFFPLPFQRYVIPLLPYACFWAAYGISVVIQGVIRALPINPKFSGGKSGGFYKVRPPR